MGNLAQGIFKRVVIKEELTYGAVPTAGGAEQLRRVTSNINLTKENYQSSEINTHQQDSDFRHGIRSTTGSIAGEISAGTYSKLTGSVVGRDFTVNPVLAGLGLTIGVTGKVVTLTRGAGSWLTDLIVPSMVVRLTVGTGLVADNTNNNLLVKSVTATVLTGEQISGTAYLAGTPTAVGLTAVGRSSFVPESGHTEKSYSIEEFYSDIAISEVFSGQVFGDVSMSIPTTGMNTIDFAVQGKTLAQKAAVAYFTSPTVPNLNGIMASSSGLVDINGVTQAVVSSADIKIGRVLENAQVIGSDSIAGVFRGRITADGTLSMYFANGIPRDFFDAETRVSVMIVMTAGSEKDADFITLYMPAVKFNGADKADAELGIMQSIPFKALLNADITGNKPKTTIYINDSKAT